MPSKEPVRRFQDILDNISRIERHVAGIGTTDELARNEMASDAIERCLARISEAAVKLEELAPGIVPEVPWENIRGLGNKLRHFYDAVDEEVLWDTIREGLPPLKVACLKAIEWLRDPKNNGDQT